MYIHTASAGVVNTLSVGSLFTGYGGVELAVSSRLFTSLAWVADNDPAAAKILATRFPGTPNLGDVTRIPWHTIAPVDVLTGGTPCQDLSHAGKRAGMTEGTRSNLWVAMREAIAVLRPGLVVWENVKGALHAPASSDVELCPGCMGDGTGVSMRALGRVLGDLASLGYDTEWATVRASDVGAPHERARIFLLAWPADDPPNSPRDRHARRNPTRRGRSGPTDRDPGPDLLLPTPTGQDAENTNGPSQLRRNSFPLNAAVTLLPTPAINDMGGNKTVAWWDDWTADLRDRLNNGNGHGASLSIEVRRDLDGWGEYAPAVTRWEQLTRPAPPPTEPGKVGARLAPPFVEWLMGLPPGWVTDVPGLSRNQQIRALGNGVVPAQAGAAIDLLLDRIPA